MALCTLRSGAIGKNEQFYSSNDEFGKEAVRLPMAVDTGPHVCAIWQHVKSSVSNEMSVVTAVVHFWTPASICEQIQPVAALPKLLKSRATPLES
jgi:hypothetical protein